MKLISALLLCVFSLACLASDILKFDDPEQERRFRQLQQEIRCPKCQNQSIADSQAGISEDLRNIIYQKIAQGQSDQQIKTFLRDRYGDFILYKPEVAGTNLLIWFGPVLIIVVLGAIVYLKVGRANAGTNELSDDDRNVINELLKKDSPDD